MNSENTCCLYKGNDDVRECFTTFCRLCGYYVADDIENSSVKFPSDCKICDLIFELRLTN